MSEGPFRGRGAPGGEPEGPWLPPGNGNGPDGAGRGDLPEDYWGEQLPPDGGPEQGLSWCVPAEAPDLAGFTGDGGAPAITPGPLLAGLTAAVAGGDGAGLAGASDDFVFAVIAAGRRMASWGTWLELSAMRELALRHPATPARRGKPGTRPASTGPASTGPASTGPSGDGQVGATPAGAGPAGEDPATDGRVRVSEFTADEVAFGLRMTWMAAADRIAYACDLAGRLPVTFAALGGGLIDPVHAKIIAEQTDILSAADAAKADPVLAAAAQSKTYGELRAAAARLVCQLDPDSVERRKQARRNEAHVRPFREESGNAGITAREMPSDEVLASWQHVDQRARDLRAAGVPGSLRELRCRAYLDLLQERDSRDALPRPPEPGHGRDSQPPGTFGSPGGPPGGNGGNPGPGTGPGGNSPGRQARSAGPGSGPSLAALVNITVPLTTLLGLSGTPGEAAGFGLLDAQSTRDLVAAAARHPHTRWCVTTLHPDGTAAAHGCAPGQHPTPPGPEPPGPEPPGPEPPGSEPPGPEPPASGPQATAPHAPPGTTDPGTTCGTSAGPGQRPPPGVPGPPATAARDYLRGLRVTLAPIARGRCDHRHAETGYQPSRKLQHLIRARSTRCTAPGCGRPAARCDLDHTVAWDAGGMTCECDLAPLCRHHHRCKQAEGWQLEQPEPGVMKWRTPAGRTFVTIPAEYLM
jgi:hypothetical protein